jgi:hypothetical protein
MQALESSLSVGKGVCVQIIAAINDHEKVESKTAGGSHWSTLAFVRAAPSREQHSTPGGFIAHLDSLSPINQRVAKAFAPGLAQLCGMSLDCSPSFMGT